MKSVVQNGTYTPGRMKNIRKAGVERTFAARSSLRERIEINEAACKFLHSNVLDFQDEITDGFRARFSKEVLLVDQETDGILRCFIQYVQDMLDRAEAAVLKRGKIDASVLKQILVERTSCAVAEALGGHSDIREKLSAKLREANLQPHEDLNIGRLLGGPAVKQMQPGGGLCRHRSILFKYTCDTLGVVKSAVLNGIFLPDGEAEVDNVDDVRKKFIPDHVWNAVLLDGDTYLVDVMNYPGELIHDEDIRARTYHRLNGRSGLKSLVAPRVNHILSDDDDDDESSSDDKDHKVEREKRTQHSRQKSRERFNRGCVIEMWCNTAQMWMSVADWTRVVCDGEPARITVHFYLAGKGSCRKTFQEDSKNLRELTVD